MVTRRTREESRTLMVSKGCPAMVDAIPPIRPATKSVDAEGMGWRLTTTGEGLSSPMVVGVVLPKAVAAAISHTSSKELSALFRWGGSIFFFFLFREVSLSFTPGCVASNLQGRAKNTSYCFLNLQRIHTHLGGWATVFGVCLHTPQKRRERERTVTEQKGKKQE